MTCCPPTAHDDMRPNYVGSIETDDDALTRLATMLGDGSRQLEFAVPDAHCAACIRVIEAELGALPMVGTARVNLSHRRVRVVFDPRRGRPSELAAAIMRVGYHTHVLDPAERQEGDPVLRELVRAMAVAGFAAGNVMLFSVSVWSGADAATRDLFHWLSALIALPAVAYAGRIFFRSAWRALRVGRTNMDVPISIGVILATALSLFETVVSGPHAYFDAAVTLLFFLLVGRTLDHLMRERARSAITNLARLAPRGATMIGADGNREYVALAEIEPGMLLELRAGERVPVDGRIESGSGEIDAAIVSGESLPLVVRPGDAVTAGMLNLSALLTLRTERPAADSFLAQMAALMEAAEGAKTRTRRIADGAAAVYAPVVHILAITTFAGWGVGTGDWHAALLNAVAVLIITCPCALALAVPIVHVVAAGRLFERGILMKDGAALERAAEIDHVAFDKTGTLTSGHPLLVVREAFEREADTVAARLAAGSNHVLSRALSAALPSSTVDIGALHEVAGGGVEALVGGRRCRLGSAAFCGVSHSAAPSAGSDVWLACDGVALARYEFADEPRPDAAAAVGELAGMGLPASLLSGDREAVVAHVARRAGILSHAAALSPSDKVERIAVLGRVMMVGDGINDAPALRAAHVSAAPASAADIGRSAADFVFTGSSLMAVPFIIDTARRAARIVNQNLAIAIGYNAIALPLAMAGHVTPLIAAIAMSSSSVLVVSNALRLGRRRELFQSHRVGQTVAA